MSTATALPQRPPVEAAAALTGFRPGTGFFIGIDSDGCAFDAMELKHKECFIPNTIRHWDLQAVSSLVRETAEFVNLYSTGRGLNRWPALVRVFDLLRRASRGGRARRRRAARGPDPGVRRVRLTR